MLKKLSLTTIIVLFLFSAAQAQYISIGPVISDGHTWMTSGQLFENGFQNVDIKTKYPGSYTLGLSVIYAKDAHWGFGGQVLYAREGFSKDIQFQPKSPIGASSYKYNLNEKFGYIRVPLRVYYFFGDYGNKLRTKAFLGPAFAFKVNQKNKVTAKNDYTETVFNDNSDALPVFSANSFDLGLEGGVGLNIYLAKAVWLNIDLLYYQGFWDALADAESPYKVETGTNWNYNIQLQAGVLFGL